MKKVAIFLLIAFVAGVAFAAGPTKPIKLKGKKADVTFDHQKHVKSVDDGGAGLKCTDCHNKKLFVKMKAGANKVTMATCGVCHSAKGKASSVDVKDKTACATCHVKS